MAEHDRGRPARERNRTGMRALRLQDPDELAGFRLVARLGTGGMGTVYLSHMPDGRPTALKIVRAELAEAPDFHRQFEREVRAASRVRGRYVVPVLESDTDGPVPWLATAYVQGPSLGEAVAFHGPMPQQAVVRLTAAVADALRSVHGAGIVHRDLKPSNVLLAAEGPQVIDFGIARASDATTMFSGSPRRIGTPGFMAPEQVMGEEISPQADVFALGLLTAFAAAGRGAFGGGDPDALLYRIVHDAPDLSACPDGLRDVVEACLAKDPADRPAPAQVIEACRVLAGEDDPFPAAGWLPADIAEEVSLRAAPAPRGPGGPSDTAAGRSYRGGLGPVVIRPESGSGTPGRGPATPGTVPDGPSAHGADGPSADADRTPTVGGPPASATANGSDAPALPAEAVLSAEAGPALADSWAGTDGRAGHSAGAEVRIAGTEARAAGPEGRADGGHAAEAPAPGATSGAGGETATSRPGGPGAPGGDPAPGATGWSPEPVHGASAPIGVPTGFVPAGPAAPGAGTPRPPGAPVGTPRPEPSAAVGPGHHPSTAESGGFGTLPRTPAATEHGGGRGRRGRVAGVTAAAVAAVLALVGGGYALAGLGGDGTTETRDIADLAPQDPPPPAVDEPVEDGEPAPEADESLSPPSPGPDDDEDDDADEEADDTAQNEGDPVGDGDDGRASDGGDSGEAPGPPAGGGDAPPDAPRDPAPAPSSPAPPRNDPPPPAPGQPGRDNCSHSSDRKRVWAEGMAGQSVRQIQCLLNHNYGNGLDTDGIFGPQTDTAVRAVQRCSGIDVDGHVGPDTWRYLDSPRRGCGG
ncbi:serine/threonine-protein kinase [Streptomyces spiramenti]|uniref:serine/threonine-protein kinase n=1 Tax=Streptomyces spiramenti TaxID=2720606 RepID=UPI001ADDC48F|nr:serine/threonine-protein kinase [Streptomyces spiramenti]